MRANPVSQSSVFEALQAAARERILVLDGAMGTVIQGHKFTEEDFRGNRFIEWSRDLRGNNDLLNLTQPDAIRDIHLAYFLAGADIVETNTFSCTTIAQADYGMEALVDELNRDGARLAREAADLAEQKDGRRRFVAGAIGPTNRTASISPDVNNPGYRAVTLRRAQGRLCAGRPRPDRGRRRHHPGRDDLRHAERQGGARRRRRGLRRASAAGCR